MTEKVEGLIGEFKTTGDALLRLAQYRELIVNDIGLGRYFEATKNGRLFSTLNKTVTIAATHNTPIAAATATPVVGFLNPANSGRAAVLQRVAFGTVSGTPAGGGAILNVQSNALITAAATGSIFSHIITGAASPQTSVMRPLNGVALTGWVAGNGPTEELILVGQATAAAAAGSGGPGATGEDIGGSIILPPGALCALMAGTGAGTSWIVNASLTWAEVDWPLI